MAGDPRHDLRGPARGAAGLAGGFILGAAGIGNAAGPLIGGALTDLLSWRWIFFLNLPVAAFAMFVTMREIKADHPEAEDTRMDYAGIVTVSVGLVSLLLAFDQVTDWGWVTRGSSRCWPSSWC